MQKVILGFALMASISVQAKSYIPKNQDQKNQLSTVAQQSLRYDAVESYVEINSKIQGKLRRSGLSKSEIKQNVSFLVADNIEQFINCHSRIVEEITEEALILGSANYDSFLTEVVENNPDAKAPLVLMKCNIYSYDLRSMDENFAGLILFEIDDEGNISRTLKDR
jgi:hypothetical protein